jgi:hypothetical protein
MAGTIDGLKNAAEAGLAVVILEDAQQVHVPVAEIAHDGLEQTRNGLRPQTHHALHDRPRPLGRRRPEEARDRPARVAAQPVRQTPHGKIGTRHRH